MMMKRMNYEGHHRRPIGYSNDDGDDDGNDYDDGIFLEVEGLCNIQGLFSECGYGWGKPTREWIVEFDIFLLIGKQKNMLIISDTTLIVIGKRSVLLSITESRILY